MACHWYVINVNSGFEWEVARSLREQVNRKELIDRLAEVLVPTMEMVKMSNGDAREFFPGYVLLKMEPDDELFRLVSATKHVTGFLCDDDGRPREVSDAEVERRRPSGN